MDAKTPQPPPEAVLIKEALQRARLSGREAARRAGISETRWRQIVNGYQDVGGVRIPVTDAPDETVARMAHAVRVTPDQLRQAGRSTAADLLDELAGPPSPASTTGAPDSNAQVEAIAALLATLSPEAREQVLSRFSHPPVGEAASSTDTSDNTRHRHAS